MPPHAGGQVVQTEQVRQGGRIAGGPLHAVEHGELPVQQRLVPQRQVDEDLIDALAQAGLADGCLYRGVLHRGECLGHVRDLGNLARLQRRGLRLDVNVLAAAQPLDELRQPLVGHLPGAVVQAGELDPEPAAEPHRDEDGGENRDQAEAAHAGELGHQAVFQVRCLRGQHHADLRPVRLRSSLDRLDGGLEGHGIHGYRPVGRAGLDLVLRGHELVVGGRVEDPSEQGRQGRIGHRERVGELKVLLPHNLGEQRSLGWRHQAARGKGPLDQANRALAGVLRPGFRDGCLRHEAELGIAWRRGVVEVGVLGRADGVVGVERHHRAVRPGVDRRPYPAQAGQVRDEGVQPGFFPARSAARAPT